MLIVTLLTLAQLASPKVQAADDGDDYETIVNRLTPVSRASSSQVAPDDMLSNAVIHGGVGFTNSFSTVRTAGDQRVQARLEGIQASVGIDLFSPAWMAEGTARSFGNYDTPSAHVTLKEFDIKLIHKGILTGQLGYRIGGGLSARYMKISETVSSTRTMPPPLGSPGSPSVPATTTTTDEDIDSEYTTPASVALVGLDASLSQRVSIGTEMSYRSALIGETVDRVSYDFLIRLDAHF